MMEIVFPGGKRVDALYKGFTIKTDQSKFNGGEGAHPAPFDLFLASIGTCAGIYVLNFCQQRGIPSEGIRLILRTERDKEKRMIGKVAIEVLLPKDFPGKYRNAVVKSAELCSVTKHMHTPPVFEIYASAPEGQETRS